MLQRPEGATVDEVASGDGLAAAHGPGAVLRNSEEEAWLTWPQRRRSAGRVYRIAARSRHEARDPRCNGLPEALSRLPKLGLGELRQQWRVLYKAEASPVPQPRTAAASCRIPDAAGRSRRPPPGASASASSICSAAQREPRGADTSSSRAEAWNSAGSRMAGSNL